MGCHKNKSGKKPVHVSGITVTLPPFGNCCFRCCIDTLNMGLYAKIVYDVLYETLEMKEPFAQAAILLSKPDMVGVKGK